MPTRWNAQVTADEVQRYRDRALLGRTVSVEDVASGVLALADNPSVTGQVLAVDAGFTAR
jgi:enoyl-[acyl-carrier-protein] reductase (NADH)